jgi:hypothetical protein
VLGIRGCRNTERRTEQEPVLHIATLPTTPHPTRRPAQGTTRGK